MNDIPSGDLYVKFVDTGTITKEQIEEFRRLWKEALAKGNWNWKTPIMTEKEREYRKVKFAKDFVKAKNIWRHIVL